MSQEAELDVLVEQLDELLGQGATDGEDALEIATLAGLAERLGADASSLEDVVRWRDEGGLELVEEGIAEVDLDSLVETLDNLEGCGEHEVEEAFADFDDLVAAATWIGRGASLRPASERVAASVRFVPDPFAFMAPTADQMTQTAVVGADPALYDYWFAVQEAGRWFS